MDLLASDHFLFGQRLYLRWLLLLSGCLLTLVGVLPAMYASPTVQATSLFTWNSAAPSPIARFESQRVVVNGKLYVFGGYANSDLQATRRSDVYDPATDSWTQLADMPEPITHAGQAVNGNTIYFAGGNFGDGYGPSTDHVWKYDIVRNSWSPGSALPAPRFSGALVRVGHTLHFIGGATRDVISRVTVDRGEHFVFSLGGTGWTQAAPLPNPRNHFGSAMLQGKVYVIGGQHKDAEGTSNQEQVDVYDPSTDTWTRAADLPAPRSHIGASTFVMSDYILVAGGSANDGGSGTALADVLLYDPQTNLWIVLTRLPAARKAAVAGSVGEQIIVATGSKTSPTATTWIGRLKATWDRPAAMPVALGEVAGGIIGNKLYLVGEGSAVTLSYNLSTDQWASPAALSQRPFVGNHHAAEVVHGKLYLFGGLGQGAGKVQIYDPMADTWTLGADMPFSAGSSASALINGDVYLAGGIVAGATTNKVARYNPVTNTWTSLADMPQGRNHAAAATDGVKLYVFGGRGPGSGDGNIVANGFDTVQIYDPATNTWQSSRDAGSTLAPLPQARGGMGKAVYLGGEFYVIGGETLTGAGATVNAVYDRVDIYNPRTNTWRLGTPMPTARHGIFPLHIAGGIYVAGGGTKAGSSSSALLEMYNAEALSAIPDPAAVLESQRLYLPIVGTVKASGLRRAATAPEK